MLDNALVPRSLCQLVVLIMRIVWALFLLAGSTHAFLFGTKEHDPCSLCECEHNTYELVVDCKNKDLSYIPLSEEWKPPVNKSIILYLDNNNLQRLDRWPAGFNITELSLSHNKISEIEDRAFEKLSNLTRLDLSHNELTGASLRAETFQGPFVEYEWEQLMVEDLDLSYNQIHSLDKDTFDHVEHVRFLNMNHNPMKEIDHSTAIALVTLRKLEKLSLAECQLIDVLDGVFNTFLNLTELNLSGNELTEVPDRLRSTYNLKVLSLNNNPIEKLDKYSFRGLENLEQLKITEMSELTKVERGAFTPLVNLQKLYLNDNPKLKSIDKRAFEDLPEGTLQEVDLSSNALRTISPDLLHWDSMVIIDIQDNPWLCDCRMKWVATKLLPIIDRKEPGRTLGINCKYPGDLDGHAFMILQETPDVFKCDKTYKTSIKVQQSHSGAIAAVVVVGLLVALLGLITILLVFTRKNKRKTAGASTSPQIRYERAPDGDDDKSSYLSAATMTTSHA